MNKLKILVLILPFLISSACISKDDDVVLDGETIYFQFEYINYAWSFQHRGFIIDQQGNIYDYKLPEDWISAENDKISMKDFESNLSKTDIRLTTLSENDIKKIEILALNAKYGKLTEPKYVMADAGGEVYAIYMASEGEEILTKYLLQQRGDVYQKNKSSASDKITNWLIDIRGETGFGHEPFDD